MDQEGWPTVGQQSVTLASHAASVKVDIERLNDCLRKGAEHIPKEVFREFSESVNALVTKVLDLPDFKSIQKTIERMDETTRSLYSAYFPEQPSNKEQSMSIADPSPHIVNPYQSGEMGGYQQKSSKLTMHEKLKTPLMQGLARKDSYRALNETKGEIRLVSISSERHPLFDIECDLFTVSLDSNPQYATLSYVWGDASDTQPIAVNGARCNVTATLKKALYRLRDRALDTPIWIDALCIDQENIEERRSQVQMMGHIYENSQQVFVHLGEYSEGNVTTALSQTSKTHSAKILDATNLFTWTANDDDLVRINKVLGYAQQYADQFPEPLNVPSFEPIILLVCLMRLLAGDLHFNEIPLLVNKNILNECLTGLNILLWQSWWDRIWCVQETVLPPKVTAMYGRYTAPLHMFIDAAENLQRHSTSCCSNTLNLEPSKRSIFTDFIGRMSTIQESWTLWKTPSDLDLPTLLGLYYDKDASDPRDKIYGLLGLVRRWGNAEPIRPDYTIDTRTLYENLALNWISSTANLDFLIFAVGIPARKAHQNEVLDVISAHVAGRRRATQIQILNTSWTPDWTLMKDPDTVKVVAERRSRYGLFNACRSFPAQQPKESLGLIESALTAAQILKITCQKVTTIGYTIYGWKWPISEATLGSYTAQALTILESKYQPPKDYGKTSISLTKSEGEMAKNTMSRAVATYSHLRICRALVADTWIDSTQVTDPRAGIRTLRRFREADMRSIEDWFSWKSNKRDDDRYRDTDPTPTEFANLATYQSVFDANRTLRAALSGRRLAIMSGNNMGLIPEESKPGDVILIFMGARVPYVVRDLGESRIGKSNGISGFGEEKPISAIIGECYVPGVMDGEFIAAQGGSNVNSRYFI